MIKQIVLFDIGGVFVTLRTLLMLLSLGLYAFVCLKNAQKQGVKPQKAATALICGFVGMAFSGKIAYIVMDKNAPNNPLISGEMTFFGIAGFLAGIRLYCFKSPAAFKRLMKLLAPPLFALTALLYLFKDITAGKPANLGIFAYTDLYGVKRANVPLIQFLSLALLMLAAYLLSKLIKKPKFRVRLLPMTLCAVSLLLPAEILRDSTQITILGLNAEAFFMWLSTNTLLISWLIFKIKKDNMPIINVFIVPVLPLLSVLSHSFILSFIMLTLPVFAALSPLFPFVKSGREKRRHRRRSFS